MRPYAPRKPRFNLGQSFDQYLAWPAACGDVVRLAFHTATAALGYHVYFRDKGFWKWFGLVLGAGQTVGAILDLLSLTERLIGTHPAEPAAPAVMKGPGPRWTPGISAGIPVYGPADSRESMLKRLPVPRGVTVQYPYMVKQNSEGEFWIKADGTTQFFSYRDGRWEEPVQTDKNDIYYRMTHLD